MKLITSARNKLRAFCADVSGSDTTEKLGMILAAAIIIGLLIAAVRLFMPTFFNDIMTQAQNLITNAGNAGGGGGG